MAEQHNQRRWNDSLSDLPAFHSTKKDTITAESIVNRVEAAALALAWDDAATFNNFFSLAMCSNGETWNFWNEIFEFFFVKTMKFLNDNNEIFKNSFRERFYAHKPLMFKNTLLFILYVYNILK